MIARLTLLVTVMWGCLLIPSCPAAQDLSDEDPFIAVVLKAQPPVQIRPSDKEEFTPLNRDDRLYPGDRIVCGEDGYASLLFADSAVELKLYPNSDLTLQGKRSSTSIIKRIFLPIGRLLSKVHRGDMEVVTPTSVASVKGTEWWTLVESSTLTRVIVIAGEVEVEHRTTGEKILVSAGNTAVTTPAGELDVTPSSKMEMPEEPSEPDNGSLDIEFEDGSGETKTLHIEFER